MIADIDRVDAARSVGGVTVVDPKGADYSIYRGVDLLTPNRAEAEAATAEALAEAAEAEAQNG